MTKELSMLSFISTLFLLISCSSQDAVKAQTETTSEMQFPVALKKKEAHQYGGWYCPDNFGFTPVDIQKLDEVPAISNRLPTEQELQEHKSLIKVDTDKHPDARALKMELPRAARIYSDRMAMSELIIVIQSIIVNEDTVVGFRFANGGNGSAWLSDVTFLSEKEVADMGSQPFYYSKTSVKASKEDIWRAICKSEYGKQLGTKFNKEVFFSSEWNEATQAHLNLYTDKEKAVGYVGMVFGNAYLQIDYERDGFHYSEKLLMIEHPEDGQTELFVANGPYPENFEKQQSNWDKWVKAVGKASQGN